MMEAKELINWAKLVEISDGEVAIDRIVVGRLGPPTTMAAATATWESSVAYLTAFGCYFRLSERPGAIDIELWNRGWVMAEELSSGLSTLGRIRSRLRFWASVEAGEADVVPCFDARMPFEELGLASDPAPAASSDPGDVGEYYIYGGWSLRDKLAGPLAVQEPSDDLGVIKVAQWVAVRRANRELVYATQPYLADGRWTVSLFVAPPGVIAPAHDHMKRPLFPFGDTFHDVRASVARDNGVLNAGGSIDPGRPEEWPPFDNPWLTPDGAAPLQSSASEKADAPRPKLFPGDVVRRRDGLGPPMMVVATEKRAGLTCCVFFDISKGPKGAMRTSARFDAEELVLVERGNYRE